MEKLRQRPGLGESREAARRALEQEGQVLAAPPAAQQGDSSDSSFSAGACTLEQQLSQVPRVAYEYAHGPFPGAHRPTLSEIPEEAVAVEAVLRDISERTLSLSTCVKSFLFFSSALNIPGAF